MSTEAIQRVAQNLPSHMMQTLSAVANQTPHYPHTPGGGYGAANYMNTVSIYFFKFITLKNSEGLKRFRRSKNMYNEIQIRFSTDWRYFSSH